MSWALAGLTGVCGRGGPGTGPRLAGCGARLGGGGAGRAEGLGSVLLLLPDGAGTAGAAGGAAGLATGAAGAVGAVDGADAVADPAA